MKISAFGAGLAVVVAASSYALPALADDPAPPARLQPPDAEADPDAEGEAKAEPTHWYGWQTLILDGSAATLTVAGLTQIGAGRDHGLAAGLLGTAIPLFVLGPPLVHVAHERWGAAAGDFLLRGAVATVSTGIAFFSSLQNDAGCPPAEHCAGPVPVGTSIAILAALSGVAAVDASVLAREPATDGSVRRLPPQARWSPVVGVTPGGGRSLGIVGTF
jgi:hypothetical protein